MGIQLGPEPEGILIQRADVLAWVRISRERWKKIRHTLAPVYVPGGDSPAYEGQRPHYRKSEVRAKLVSTLESKAQNQQIEIL